ncbi:unnamed protein product [Cuscuta epithymum]|uniref:Uncharacterized protein n=1 Tax=Cuscuta epithymum TaxID=186058 RepID=A0AAV0F6F7_9ASTE|nr:unnamed protein product [Cuscuta epithymum]
MFLFSNQDHFKPCKTQTFLYQPDKPIAILKSKPNIYTLINIFDRNPKPNYPNLIHHIVPMDSVSSKHACNTLDPLVNIYKLVKPHRRHSPIRDLLSVQREIG